MFHPNITLTIIGT